MFLNPKTLFLVKQYDIILNLKQENFKAIRNINDLNKPLATIYVLLIFYC